MADNSDKSEQPQEKQSDFYQGHGNNLNPYRYSNPNSQRQNFNNYPRNSYNNNYNNRNQQRPNFHYNNNNQKRKFHGNNQFNNYGNKRQTTSSFEDQFNVKDYYHKSMLEDPWLIKNN
jgi:hypothetical protein